MPRLRLCDQAGKRPSVRDQIDWYFGIKNPLLNKVREGVILRKGSEVKIRNID